MSREPQRMRPGEASDQYFAATGDTSGQLEICGFNDRRASCEKKDGVTDVKAKESIALWAGYQRDIELKGKT